MQNQSTSAFNNYVARQQAQTISRTKINRFGVHGQAFDTVSFFTSTDASGTVAATFDFPEENFLDQAGTTTRRKFRVQCADLPESRRQNHLVLGIKVVVVAGKRLSTENYTAAEKIFGSVEHFNASEFV